LKKGPSVGLIRHSDRGSRYCSRKYWKLIHQFNMKASVKIRLQKVPGKRLRTSLFYYEKTQNHVEKPVCIFMCVGGQDILSAPVCVRWRTGRYVDAQAGLDPAMPVYLQSHESRQQAILGYHRVY